MPGGDGGTNWTDHGGGCGGCSCPVMGNRNVHSAAIHDDVKALEQMRSRINETDPQIANRTPLHAAVAYNHWNAVKTSSVLGVWLMHATSLARRIALRYCDDISC